MRINRPHSKRWRAAPWPASLPDRQIQPFASAAGFSSACRYLLLKRVHDDMDVLPSSFSHTSANLASRGWPRSGVSLWMLPLSSQSSSTNRTFWLEFSRLERMTSIFRFFAFTLCRGVFEIQTGEVNDESSRIAAAADLGASWGEFPEAKPRALNPRTWQGKSVPASRHQTCTASSARRDGLALPCGSGGASVLR